MLKNAKSKDSVMIPNADHIFEEDNAVKHVEDFTVKGYKDNL